MKLTEAEKQGFYEEIIYSLLGVGQERSSYEDQVR